MKKRIFSLLLAVCMVLAAVPAVTAAPAEQHTVSVDSAQLKQAATAGVLAQDSAVLDSDLLNAAATVAPMAAEDFAVYGPNVLGMACKAGTDRDFACRRVCADGGGPGMERGDLCRHGAHRG